MSTAGSRSAGPRGSTVAATPNTLVHRDEYGRAKIATPAAEGDAATKGYVDALVRSNTEGGYDIEHIPDGASQYNVHVNLSRGDYTRFILHGRLTSAGGHERVGCVMGGVAASECIGVGTSVDSSSASTYFLAYSGDGHVMNAGAKLLYARIDGNTLELKFLRWDQDDAEFEYGWQVFR